MEDQVAKMPKVKNCLKKMDNTLNVLYKLHRPKHNVHRYTKVAVLKDSCEKAMSEIHLKHDPQRDLYNPRDHHASQVSGSLTEILSFGMTMIK